MATYYVSDATGNDGDDGLSEGNAWATIQHAIDNMAAADIIHVKADGIYYEALDATTCAVGVPNDPIHFWGYTATPKDGGMVQIDGNGKVLADGLLCRVAETYHYYVWTNFRWTDFSDKGIDGLMANTLIFRYCEFDDCGGRGAVVKNSCMFVNCHSHDNGDLGFYMDGACHVIGCLARGNTNTGIHMEGVDNVVIGCTSADNGRGMYLNNGENVVVGNTIWGNSETSDWGIYFANTSHFDCVINNIITECTVGIQGSDAGSTWKGHVGILHNLLFGNGTDYVNASTAIGEITSDPQFTDDANGDFTPVTGSPALGVGVHAANVPNAPSQDGTTHYIGSTSGESVGDYPAVGDVEAGVIFDNSAKTGTFTVPAVEDVEVGVMYGAGGTEFTGTMSVGDGGSGLAIQGNLVG